MKVNILQERLAYAVKEAGRVVPARAELPILADVHLETRSGRLVVTGANLEQWVTVHAGAQVIEEGAITVPAKLANRLVALMAKEAVDLEVVAKTLRLVCNGRTVEIAGKDAEDYPPVPDCGPTVLTIDGGALRTALDRTLFAASTDDIRPVLAGIYLQVGEESAKLVGSDGFRLSVAELLLSRVGTVEHLEVNIPSAPLTTLRRFLREGEDVSVALAEGWARFSLAHSYVDVVAKLIAGSYPDYTRTYPSEYAHETTFDTAALLAEAKAAREVAKDSSGIIRLYSDPNKLRVAAKAEEFSSFESTVDAQANSKSKVALNVEYLIDALDTMGERTSLAIGNVERREPVRLCSDDDQTYQHYIMPTAVQW